MATQPTKPTSAPTSTQNTAATGKKPNILFIMSDDLGSCNVSAYNHGIMGYRTPNKWMADRAFLLVPAQEIVAKWLDTLKEFPLRQRPSSFSVDEVVQRMMPRAG